MQITLQVHFPRRLREMTDSFATSYESIGSTSSSLLERVKAEDQGAWQRLVRLYGRLVLHWCRVSGLQAADRADVFQEVFRAVAGHIDDFRHDRPGDSFRAWLRTVTRSKVLDHFRRQERQPLGAGGSEVHKRLLAYPEVDAESDAGAEVLEQTLLLREALGLIEADFEERTWQAFWRTAADGIATSAVAEELGMPPATVRQAKSRVLRRLRDELEGLV